MYIIRVRYEDRKGIRSWVYYIYGTGRRVVVVPLLQQYVFGGQLSALLCVQIKLGVFVLYMPSITRPFQFSFCHAPPPAHLRGCGSGNMAADTEVHNSGLKFACCSRFQARLFTASPRRGCGGSLRCASVFAFAISPLLPPSPLAGCHGIYSWRSPVWG